MLKRNQLSRMTVRSDQHGAFDALTVKLPAGLAASLFFLAACVWLIAASMIYRSHWVKHGSPSARAAIEASLVLVLILGGVRIARVGVRMDDNGVTVRNFWWSYKVSWSEVRHFGVGTTRGDHLREGNEVLAVVLHDGRTRLVAAATRLRYTERRAIKEMAARHGLQADLSRFEAVDKRNANGRLG